MIVSRCCKESVYMTETQDTLYYVCSFCNMACDTLMSLSLIPKDDYDTIRHCGTLCFE